MVASVLIDQGVESPIDKLLCPAPLASGAEPEQRVVVCGISWNSYLAFDRQLGEDRSGPLLYFLEGELEIMTTSKEHERIKEWLGGLMDIYFEETGTEIIPRGHATMRLAAKTAGVEPDKSWCLGQDKEFPDLVLEIALTSGGVNKLEIYRRFQIPEVWFWRNDKLQIFVLDDSGTYHALRQSRLLPGMDIILLEECVMNPSWQLARQTFRARLKKSK